MQIDLVLGHSKTSLGIAGQIRFGCQGNRHFAKTAAQQGRDKKLASKMAQGGG